MRNELLINICRKNDITQCWEFCRPILISSSKGKGEEKRKEIITEHIARESRPLLVGFLPRYIQIFYQVLFAQVYPVRMTQVYLLFSYQDILENMIRTRV